MYVLHSQLMSCNDTNEISLTRKDEFETTVRSEHCENFSLTFCNYIWPSWLWKCEIDCFIICVEYEMNNFHV